MILMNCSDLEKFDAMLEQPELKEWDIKTTVSIRFIILNLLSRRYKKELELRLFKDWTKCRKNVVLIVSTN